VKVTIVVGLPASLVFRKLVRQVPRRGWTLAWTPPRARGIEHFRWPDAAGKIDSSLLEARAT
jgi:hypothetical protein